MSVSVEARSDFNEEERKKQKQQVDKKKIKISYMEHCEKLRLCGCALEFPVFSIFDRLDSPSELVSQSF
jgi:hypothetical protein